LGVQERNKYPEGSQLCQSVRGDLGTTGVRWEGW